MRNFLKTVAVLLQMSCGCGTSKAVLPKQIKGDALEALTKETKLTAKEVKALYRRFRLLAPSGYLLPDQFRRTMGVLGLTDDSFLPDRMFLVFDIDEDGKLSFREFALSLAIMIRGTEDEKLKLSFEMSAGRRGATGLSLADFQQLIRACNVMMQSLVTPDANPLDDIAVRRLFNDLSSDVSDDDGEAVITMEDYKAAAQSNEEFLVCLGIHPSSEKIRSRRAESIHSNRRRIISRAESYDERWTEKTPTSVGGGQEHYYVSGAQVDELRARVGMLRDIVLQDRSGQNGFMESGGSLPSSSTGSNAWPPLALQDPDERWWTPLPKKLRKKTATIHEAPKSIDELAFEFDKVLGWCNNVCDSNGLPTQASPSSLSPSPTRDLRIFPRDASEERLRPRPENAASGASDEPIRGASSDLEEVTSLPSCSEKSMPVITATSGAENERSTSDRCFTARSEESKSSRNLGAASTRRSHSPGVPRSRKRHRLLGPKKGLAVHFGHENWNMVLSMMIGIRMSVGRIKHEMARELTPVDFIMKEKFSIIPRMANIFDSEVSKRVTMTRFIDYAPMVFSRIRGSFGINQDDYLRSVGPEQLLGNMVLGNLSSLSELSSEGKSGAFFYYTADGKYMMKTVTPKEQQLLKRMLKRYYDYITKNPETLIVRFLGLHCLRVCKDGKLSSGKRLHFVVMGNMFNTPFEMHRRYDLKGSWIGRHTPGKSELDPSVALKDVDFKEAGESINVGPEVKEKLIQQIESDSAFLRDNNVIDYSLLLGVHQVGAPKKEGDDSDVDDGRASVMIREGFRPPEPGQPYVSMATLARTSTSATISVVPSSPGCGVLNGSNRVVPVHQRDLGGLLSADQKQLYFFGIIDILTPYDTFKRCEHHLKALRHDRRGVSCCPPVFYAERFNDCLRTAFQ